MSTRKLVNLLTCQLVNLSTRQLKTILLINLKKLPFLYLLPSFGGVGGGSLITMKAYIKLELQFFENPKFITLREKEGCAGEGCVLELIRYLRVCPEGMGCQAALRNIARTCKKSKNYLLHIINDYEVFTTVDNEYFYCPYLEKTLQNIKNNNKSTVENGDTSNEQPLENRERTVQFTPSQVVDNQHPSLYINNINNINDINNINHPTTMRARDDADAEKNKNHIAQPTPQQTTAPMPPSPSKQAAAAPKQAAAANEQPPSSSNDLPRPAAPPSAADCQHELRRLNACNKPVKAMTLNAYPHASTSHEVAEKKAKLQKCEQDILNHLYGDAAFMMSLQSLTGLCVYRSAKTRYYCLQWFRMIRHSQGKPIVDEEDAKRHLLALLQKGRKTRNDFHRWHNDQLQP